MEIEISRPKPREVDGQLCDVPKCQALVYHTVYVNTWPYAVCGFHCEEYEILAKMHSNEITAWAEGIENADR